jgi:hypothetical protein
MGPLVGFIDSIINLHKKKKVKENDIKHIYLNKYSNLSS